MNKNKILIIQTAFIGDVILATALIEYINKDAPDAHIDFCLRKGNESLIQTHPAIRHVFVWDKKEKYSSLITIIKKIRQEKYDIVLNIQRFFNSGLIAILSGAKTKVGFKQNPLSFFFSHTVLHKIPYLINNQYQHEVQRNLQLYQILKKQENAHVPIQKVKPRLYFTPLDRKKIEDLSLAHDYFVIAPSSVWYTKQWQLEKWRQLIQLLPNNTSICIIGASNDLKAIGPLLNENNIINLVGKLSLRESALLMQNAKRVFVNDSAPLHLASSVNARTTAIFCSTTPQFGYFPLSDDSKVIEASTPLSCKPCGLHGHMKCPLEHFKCSKDIDPQDVVKTIF